MKRASELEMSRQRFELRLGELREAMTREVGLAPRRPGWVLPLVAAAAGLALALALKGRLRRRRITA